MKRVVVLGNSLAGIKALEEIRALQPQTECLLISLDGNYPYDPDRLWAYLAKDISHHDLFYKPQKYYAENNIQIILDKKIEKVNFKKNQLTTEAKEAIGYDILIIAQTPDYKFPDIKGANKKGIFGFHKLSEIDQILKELTFVDTVVIQTDSEAGLKMADAIRKKGKEVLLIADAGPQSVMQNLQEQGVQVLFDNAITEILGDGNVKAVRLKSGKVMAADIVLFDPVLPNLRLFQDTPLRVNQKICVDRSFKTNIENVYAVDEACECAGAGMAQTERSAPDLFEQGKVVAKAIHDQEIPVSASFT